MRRISEGEGMGWVLAATANALAGGRGEERFLNLAAALLRAGAEL